MGKRATKRIIAGYKGTLFYRDKGYTGLIENLSETGINVMCEALDESVDFALGEDVELVLETPGGEKLNLNCTIKWSRRLPPHHGRTGIGLEIIDPPWKKIAFFL